MFKKLYIYICMLLEIQKEIETYLLCGTKNNQYGTGEWLKRDVEGLSLELL